MTRGTSSATGAWGTGAAGGPQVTVGTGCPLHTPASIYTVTGFSAQEVNCRAAFREALVSNGKKGVGVGTGLPFDPHIQNPSPEPMSVEGRDLEFLQL